MVGSGRIKGLMAPGLSIIPHKSRSGPCKCVAKVAFHSHKSLPREVWVKTFWIPKPHPSQPLLSGEVLPKRKARLPGAAPPPHPSSPHLPRFRAWLSLRAAPPKLTVWTVVGRRYPPAKNFFPVHGWLRPSSSRICCLLTAPPPASSRVNTAQPRKDYEGRLIAILDAGGSRLTRANRSP